MARPEFDRRSAEKAQLIASLDSSRRTLSRELDGVATALDLPSQFRISFNHGQWRWLGAALVAGVAAGVMIPATRKGKKGRSSRSLSSQSRSAGTRPGGLGKTLLGVVGGAMARGVLTMVVQPAVLAPLQKEAEKWFKAGLHKR